MSTDTIKYLALGDSYTIGESVNEGDRWPNVLAEQLNLRGLNIASPKIIARTGWTTDELINAIQKQAITESYDLVSLLIGVNNQYRGYPIDQFRKEYKELLEQAIVFANGNARRVIVLSIPDYGVTPFAQSKNPSKIATEIDLYNSVKKEISISLGVSFYDITSISREAQSNPALVAEDGLHPSGKMYHRWVEMIVEDVLDKLVIDHSR
jgi:lysophospholipase L1-like esterase